MEDEIGVGIVGYGLAARVFHAPFVSAVGGLKLLGFVERTSNQAVEAYPATKIVRTVEELLRDLAVQLVVVATPNETHFPIAKQALEAGKHVIIDKPFAASSAQAAELIELATAKHLVLAPFHNRRWDGDFLTVKKLLAMGSLGRLVTFESHFDRFRPVPRENSWKETRNAANGLLFDLGPHLVDQAVALFGLPSTVTASVRMDRDGSQIEDAFDIALQYDGLRVWCRSSMLACDAAPRFLLHGTRGSFKKYGVDPQEPALVSGAKPPPLGETGSDDWLEETEEMWGTLTIAPVLSGPAALVRTKIKTERGDYRTFYANVRDVISGKAELAVPAEAGLTALKLLELARLSSRERRTVAV